SANQEIPGHEIGWARSQTGTEAVLEQERSNLARTFSRLDMGAWLRAVGLLSEAPYVYVIGLRDSVAVAALRGLRVSRVRAGGRRRGVSVVDEVREFAEGEVLVAVSVRRYAGETVRVAEYACDRGLRVIALTDNAASPLAELAVAALYAETDGVGEFR